MPDERDSFPIDPNEADPELLTRLPGVGPALANRIVAGRPYRQIDDLQRISGMGPSTLERIEPHLTFQAAPPIALPPPDEVEAGDSEADKAEARSDSELEDILRQSIEAQSQTELEPGEPEVDDDEPVASDWLASAEADDAPHEEHVDAAPAVVPTATPVMRAGFTRTETLWLVLGTGLISIVMAAIVSLAVIAGINGTLDMANHPALRQTQRDLQTIEDDLNAMHSDVTSLQARVQALEGISGRMTAVEDGLQALQTDMQAALTEVETARQRLDDVEAQTQGLDTRITRFETFLQGLADLLATLGSEAQEAIP